MVALVFLAATMRCLNVFSPPLASGSYHCWPRCKTSQRNFLAVGHRFSADGLNAGKPTVKHEELTLIHGFPHHVNISGQRMPISCLACLDTGWLMKVKRGEFGGGGNCLLATSWHMPKACNAGFDPAHTFYSESPEDVVD